MKEQLLMKESQKIRWEKIKAKGKKKYIINHGILGGGIPTAILFTLITTWMDNKSLTFNQELCKSFLISLITFSASGILFGFWTWYCIERFYRKNKTD
jgi:hypothetical protein